MKAMLMSIQSTPAYNIVTLKKELELRLKVPDLEKLGLKGIWVYLYVTQAKPYLIRNNNFGWQYKDKYSYYVSKKTLFFENVLNSKIVARFWFDEYDFIEFAPLYGYYSDIDDYRYAVGDNGLKDLCLSYNLLSNYGKGKDLYALHIKNLEIFETPKELNEFYRILSKREKSMLWENDLPMWKKVSKAPQSYQYVEVEE